MAGGMDALSASALADLAGTTAAEVQRLADLGILAARDGTGPFRAGDAPKVRLAEACEPAGLPMEGIAAAVRAGRLSLAFLEVAPYRRWAVRSARTHRQVSRDTGIPLDAIGGILDRLTEERGDAAAAVLAETLAQLVEGAARERGGVPVKRLGDGVMLHFREPAAAVLAALELLGRLPAAGLPPAHVGVAAGPVVAQGGDYFGRTVNLAARIGAHAGAGQVLVSQSVADAAPPAGVVFSEAGEVELKGFARPVRLLEARWA
jgi:Adenylate and Guanylate cyclase catalytic domain